MPNLHIIVIFLPQHENNRTIPSRLQLHQNQQKNTTNPQLPVVNLHDEHYHGRHPLSHLIHEEAITKPPQHVSNCDIAAHSGRTLSQKHTLQVFHSVILFCFFCNSHQCVHISVPYIPDSVHRKCTISTMIYHHYNVAYISGAPSLVTTTNILAAYLCIKREE